jgi:NAD(P)-dependent dehydrogenase (short-subunit alcohol dehydrogenase family)
MVAEPPGDPGTLFSVSGKVVLVTGGSRGIGAMIARGFLDAGATVYLTARNARGCEKAAEQLRAHGPCVALPTDVATTEGIVSLHERLTERVAALHVLVNNAGVTWGAPLEKYPDVAFDHVLGVNVKATFTLTQRLLPLLRAAATPDDPARVINVGSIDGLRIADLENYAYSASKAAVHLLTRQLALRLAPDHITVNALAPGPFDSRMMSFVLDKPESRALVAAGVPLGRVGRPDDVAGASLYLASRAGSYLTGVVLPVDGGITAR